MFLYISQSEIDIFIPLQNLVVARIVNFGYIQFLKYFLFKKTIILQLLYNDL